MSVVCGGFSVLLFVCFWVCGVFLLFGFAWGFVCFCCCSFFLLMVGLFHIQNRFLVLQTICDDIFNGSCPQSLSI